MKFRFNWYTLGFGALLALMDSISLPILKGVKMNEWPRWLLSIPICLYALDPIIFYTALGTETLTIMNIVWDLMSDVIVTIIGIFFFKEVLPLSKKIGVGMSFIGLFLMTYEGDGWGDMFSGWFN
jgi:drug/metabolite transporter (DMT)-like permease